ncbi:hypothetical protein HJG60_011393 [Phyllostomus discolor]|uniref:Uncharacterized protein n=1 Tax=Phyllostomus discolor TaxID=89673 RepID=A0A834A4S6_9CHIR|nr:hypothetical protein HJG60_011393 [Phyllostomus discolor]
MQGPGAGAQGCFSLPPSLSKNCSRCTVFLRDILLEFGEGVRTEKEKQIQAFAEPKNGVNGVNGWGVGGELGFSVLQPEVSGKHKKAGTIHCPRVRGLALGSCLPASTYIQVATRGRGHGFVRIHGLCTHTCTCTHTLPCSAS